MQSLCDSTERNGPRAGSRTYVPLSQTVSTFVGSVALLACLVASAASASEPSRFHLVGTGTLSLDQAVLKSGNVQIRAYLTPSNATMSALPPVQEGAGFALIASLATASTACYNDTIFRDGFDGDGL
ncbi:MAG: hypothetical protein P4L92_02395 [Rudaea sp.]|nr:hypothetical protein [Rudaea sp.]